MKPVYLTATNALVAGAAPTDYGIISPAQQFDFLDVFVDPGGQDGTLILEVIGQPGAGGVKFTAAKVTIRTGIGGPSSVAIPQIQVIGSTIYDLHVSSPDTNFAAVKCTMAGYNRQAGTTDEVVNVTAPLIQGVEVNFGNIFNYHTYVQASVDFGPNNSHSETIWRIYGIADVLGGGIRVLVAEKRIKPGPDGIGFGELVLQLPEQYPVHFDRDQSDDFRTIGIEKFELFAEAVGPFNAGAPDFDSPPHATLVGFDPNCPCEGSTGATGPTGATGATGGAGLMFSGVVWKPGVTASGIYPTYQAALAVLQTVTVGNVLMGVDSSAAAANVDNVGMPAGGWDTQSRIGLTPATPGGTATVGVLDGATLKNLPDIYGNLQLQSNATVLPAVSYVGPGIKSLLLSAGATLLVNGGTRQLADVATTLVVLAINAGFFGAAGGFEIFKLLAGGSIFGSATSGTVIRPGNGLVGGTVGGTSCAWAHDVTSDPVIYVGADFAGTGTCPIIEGVREENTIEATGAITVTIDASFVAGSASPNERIDCYSDVGAVVTIQLPDPTLVMNKGRRLLVVDANGNSGVIPIVLKHFGATLLNGAAADKNLSSNFGSWLISCVKGGTVNGAWVVSLMIGAP